MQKLTLSKKDKEDVDYLYRSKLTYFFKKVN